MEELRALLAEHLGFTGSVGNTEARATKWVAWHQIPWVKLPRRFSRGYTSTMPRRQAAQSLTRSRLASILA